ncbi:SWEET sugar transporter [Phytophthora cactorum]|nr:SWEET sugar transporter [Phytophthora cactorum]
MAVWVTLLRVVTSIAQIGMILTSLAINLSVMMFFTTVLWVAISIVDGDMLIMSLNIAGVVLSIIQITLYIRFRPGQCTMTQEEPLEFADKQIAIRRAHPAAAEKRGGHYGADGRPGTQSILPQRRKNTSMLAAAWRSLGRPYQGGGDHSRGAKEMGWPISAKWANWYVTHLEWLAASLLTHVNWSIFF